MSRRLEVVSLIASIIAHIEDRYWPKPLPPCPDAPSPIEFQPGDLVTGLVKSYGSVRALAGIDLEAAPGTVLAVLGPNGAGKTTAVRVLTTLLRPDAGSARVAGLDVVEDAARLRAKIGLAGQYAAIDDNLTGVENLVMVGRLYGERRRAARRRAGELLERFDLSDAGDRVAKSYSGGMRRRLDLAAALVARAAGAVPGRADHRARPAQPPGAVDDDRGPRGRRHHRAPHHAVPRRGRPARPPHRRDRSRPGDRRGHRRRAEGPRRRRARRGHADPSRARRTRP